MNTRIFLTLFVCVGLFGADQNSLRRSYVQKRDAVKTFEPDDPFDFYQTRSIDVFLHVNGYEPVEGRVFQIMPLTPGRISQVGASLIIGAVGFWVLGIPIASSPISLIGEALTAKRLSRPYLKLKQKATGEEIRNTFYDLSPFDRALRDVLSGRYYDVLSPDGKEQRGYPMILDIHAEASGRVNQINAVFEPFHGSTEDAYPIHNLKDVGPKKNCWTRIKEFTGMEL